MFATAPASLALDSRPSTLDPVRSGMTLIELLVVIIILTTIVAAAIPLCRRPTTIAGSARRPAGSIRSSPAPRPGPSRSTGRSASRSSGWRQIRAEQATTRDEDNGVCLEVFYVEQQPPYAGFDANSRAVSRMHPERSRHWASSCDS